MPFSPPSCFTKREVFNYFAEAKKKGLLETWSADQGKTWIPLQPTSLPNNNSGIDAVTLKTGIHLLICNPIEKGRNKLAVLASSDGKKWNDLIVPGGSTSGRIQLSGHHSGE